MTYTEKSADRSQKSELVKKTPPPTPPRSGEGGKTNYPAPLSASGRGWGRGAKPTIRPPSPLRGGVGGGVFFTASQKTMDEGQRSIQLLCPSSVSELEWRINR